MAKIRYVQLEPEAIVAEPDFQMMTAEQRGVYLSIMLYLYCNKGRLKLEIEQLRRLCNVSPDFDFQTVINKFTQKNGLIYHRSVSQSMAKARRCLQARRAAGLMGARVKWQGRNTTDGNAAAKKT